MTNHSLPSTVPTRSIVALATGIALTLALTACRSVPEPKAQPARSAPTSSTTPEQSRGPTPPTASVIGKLDVLIALTTADSVIPNPPLSYSMLVQPAGDPVSTAYTVDPDGTFALPLAPGNYNVTLLQINAADLGPQPLVLPLSTAQGLELHAPASGCIYGGVVHVTYGRLPAGSLTQQQTLVERASSSNHENYSFVYRPDGGFVMAGMGVSAPAQNQRPASAQGCAEEKFNLVKA